MTLENTQFGEPGGSEQAQTREPGSEALGFADALNVKAIMAALATITTVAAETICKALQTPNVERVTPSNYGFPAQRFPKSTPLPKPPKRVLPGGRETSGRGANYNYKVIKKA